MKNKNRFMYRFLSKLAKLIKIIINQLHHN
jgi:hypothetical protein